MRRTIFLTPLVMLVIACNGGRPLPLATPTATQAPAPAGESGMFSQEASGEGAFLVDLTTERWSRLLPAGQYIDAVSPDGGTVIYHTEAGMFARRLDGSELRRLADAPMQAVFSPDGNALALWSFDEELLLMDWPGGDLTRVPLPSAVTRVAWSEDSLAVSSDTATYFVSGDGTVLPADAPAPASPLHWAPDGSRLAFWTREESGSVLFTLAPGEQARVLARLAGLAASRLSWSPDGELLAVAVFREAAADPLYEANDVLVLDAVTGETRFTVTGAGHLVANWSPVEPSLLVDGNACLFEEWQLMLVNADGTDLRPLASRHDGSFIGDHQWSPDGRQVATTSVEPGAATVVDVGTGETRTVFRSSAGLLYPIRWLSEDRLIVSVSGGGDACTQSLGERSRVVLP